MYEEQNKHWQMRKEAWEKPFQIVPWKWPQRAFKLAVFMLVLILASTLGSMVTGALWDKAHSAPAVVKTETMYRCDPDPSMPCHSAAEFRAKFKRGGFGKDTNGVRPAAVYQNPRRAIRIISAKISRVMPASASGTPRYHARRLHTAATCTARDWILWTRDGMCHSFTPPKKLTNEQVKKMVDVAWCSGFAVGAAKAALKHPYFVLFSGLSYCGWQFYRSLD